MLLRLFSPEEIIKRGTQRFVLKNSYHSVKMKTWDTNLSHRKMTSKYIMAPLYKTILFKEQHVQEEHGNIVHSMVRE